MPSTSNNGSDSAGTPEERSRHGEIRIAGRRKPCRRAARRGERDAGVASAGKLGMDGAHPRPLFQIGAVIGERHVFVLFARAPEIAR